jgi:superfamily II DNA helicase RecQ
MAIAKTNCPTNCYALSRVYQILSLDMAYTVWHNNDQAIGPNIRILLVLVDFVASTDFLVLCKRLARLGRLSRIVIDEAHLAVSSTYRMAMSKLYLLRTISEARLLLLSATVPPQMERQLQDCFSTTFETIRTSTVRSNLKYVVQLYENEGDKVAAETAMAKLIATVQAQRSQFRDEDRAIVFCPSKQMTIEIANYPRIRVHFYHADLSALEKQTRYDAWHPCGDSQGDVQLFVGLCSGNGSWWA